MSHDPTASPRSSISLPTAIDQQAQIQQLQHMVQAMMQQQQQQSQLLQQAQAAAAAAQQAAPVVVRAPELPKIKSPSTFGGAMGFVVDDWLRELKQQFSYYGPAKFPDDASKVRFAAAHFSGAATLWWEHQPAVATWTEFEERLHGRFRPVQAAMTARQRLGKLRQRAGQAVNQYVSAFQNVLTPIDDMSDADQVHHFTNGLLPAIAAKVWEKHPKTLYDAIDAAVSVEAIYNFGRAAMPQGGRAGHGSSASSAGGADPNAMDLSNIEGLTCHDTFDEPPEPTTSGESAPMLAVLEKLSSMEARLNALSSSSSSSVTPKPRGGNGLIVGLDAATIKKLRAEGKCFRCKKPGHMKNDCPMSKNE